MQQNGQKNQQKGVGQEGVWARQKFFLPKTFPVTLGSNMQSFEMKQKELWPYTPDIRTYGHTDIRTDSFGCVAQLKLRIATK